MSDNVLAVGDAVFIDNGVLYPEDWEVHGVIILEEMVQLSVIAQAADEAAPIQNELWLEWNKDKTKPYPDIWGVFVILLQDKGVKFCSYNFKKCPMVSL